MQNQKTSGWLSQDRDHCGSCSPSRFSNWARACLKGLHSSTILYAPIALILYIGYLLIFPLNIVTFESNRIEVGKKLLSQGEVQPLRYPFTKHVDLLPIVTTRLLNDVGYQLSDHLGSTGKGYTDKWFYNVEIPKHLPPGKYRIERIFVFRVNVLREEKFRLLSEEFEVVAKR
jgi:hypothetical protein